VTITVTTATVTFDEAGLSNRPLNGQYPTGQIDWGTDKWYGSPPWGSFTTNSVSFANFGVTSATFSFVSSRRLVSIQAYNGGGSTTVTISCSGNPTKSQAVGAGQVATISTGWTTNCTTVTLGSSNGWNTNFDNFLYTIGVPDTSPPTISNVQSAPAATSTAITWITDEPADSLVEYGATTAYGSLTTLDPTPVTSHTVQIAGLSPATLYHYRVKSKDAEGNLATSQDFTFTTLAESPSQTVTFDDKTGQDQPLNGQYPAGVIDWGTGQWYHAAPWGVFTTKSASFATASGTSRTFSFVGGTRKLVSVRAYNGSGSSTTITLSCSGQPTKNQSVAAGQVATVSTGWTGGCTTVTVGSSNGWNTNFDDFVHDSGAVTPDTTPPTISSVQSTNVTSVGATITWTTNEASDTQVEYGTTTSYGFSTTLNTSMVTSHSQALSGLTAGTLYHYRVKSRDATGNLATSGDFTFTTATPDTTAPTISAVQATNVTSNGATITWTTNEAADTQVEYGTTTGYGSSTTLNTSMVTNHSQPLGGLAASTLYYYRVLSKDAAGNLATSGDFTFTTGAADTTPPTISGVAAGSITSSGATITWTTNEASDTHVEYGTTTSYGSSTTLAAAMVTSHSQALSGLAVNTLYHYRVKSRDAAGNLATSGDFTFTTATASPTQTITFDDRAGQDQPLNGQYPTGVINWGSGQWYHAAPWGLFTTKSVSFATAASGNRTFTFVTPRRLVSVRAYNGGGGSSTVTLACAGQTTKTQSVGAGQVVTITTGWSATCTTVTVNSSNGWNTNFDDFVLDSGMAAVSSMLVQSGEGAIPDGEAGSSLLPNPGEPSDEMDATLPPVVPVTLPIRAAVGRRRRACPRRRAVTSCYETDPRLCPHSHLRGGRSISVIPKRRLSNAQSSPT
jgi:hypothetical protein